MLLAIMAALCVAALVLSDYKGFRPGRYVFKPLSAISFVLMALLVGASDSDYGRTLLAGLGLCLLGDLLLMPERDSTFLAGLGAFLLGHLVYAAAFLQLSTDIPSMLFACLPVAALAIFSVRWLKPHLPTPMKAPVIAYIAVISAMLLCAAATRENSGFTWILCGATGFAISDLAVSRQQFVTKSRINQLWGTPLYFLSQMLLAYSVSFQVVVALPSG